MAARPLDCGGQEYDKEQWALSRERGFLMTTAEILSEIPRLSQQDRRRILDRILEIEDEAERLEVNRRMADEAFQMLDAMEAEDAARQSR
jgi:hypothetical protein